MKRFLVPGLVLLFVFGFLVRLYRFNNPIADWHAWRQGDTNAVSQIYVNRGVDLLNPRYFDISNVQSEKENPQGFRFVEFPMYNALQAALFGLFKFIGLTLAEWGRLISIFATLGGAFFVYLLVRKYASEVAGILSALFYLFLPFSIYYGRAILPDPSMAATILGGIYFFDKWLSKKSINHSVLSPEFELTIFFTTLSFLLKPHALFFTLPFVWLAYKNLGLGFFKKWQLWLFTILSLAPLVLWRAWIGQHPEGIPAATWLLNGNGIRFRPAFFRWIFYERITKLILGFAGVVFLIDGIFWLAKHKNSGFFISFLVSTLVYVSVVATGNVQHDYYQILIIPTVSIFAGLGTWQLFETTKKIAGKNVGYIICCVLIIFSLFFSWQKVRDYFNINDWGMVHAGEAANKILPKDAKVIAPYDNSTTFLNIIGRPGWPVFETSIENLIRMGAEYLVIANPTPSDFNGFGKKYQIVAQSKEYLILKLNN